MASRRAHQANYPIRRRSRAAKPNGDFQRINAETVAVGYLDAGEAQIGTLQLTSIVSTAGETPVTQENFSQGTFRIREGGRYVFQSNIVFGKGGSLTPGRADKPKVGFFAAISVETPECVVIDGNGFCLLIDQNYQNSELQHGMSIGINMSNAWASTDLIPLSITGFAGDNAYSPAQNVTIRNMSISGFDFAGIHTDPPMNNLLVENVKFSNCVQNSIICLTSRGVDIRNCTIFDTSTTRNHGPKVWQAQWAYILLGMMQTSGNPPAAYLGHTTGDVRTALQTYITNQKAADGSFGAPDEAAALTGTFSGGMCLFGDTSADVTNCKVESLRRRVVEHVGVIPAVPGADSGVLNFDQYARAGILGLLDRNDLYPGGGAYAPNTLAIAQMLIAHHWDTVFPASPISRRPAQAFIDAVLAQPAVEGNFQAATDSFVPGLGPRGFPLVGTYAYHLSGQGLKLQRSVSGDIRNDSTTDGVDGSAFGVLPVNPTSRYRGNDCSNVLISDLFNAKATSRPCVLNCEFNSARSVAGSVYGLQVTSVAGVGVDGPLVSLCRFGDQHAEHTGRLLHRFDENPPVNSSDAFGVLADGSDVRRMQVEDCAVNEVIAPRLAGGYVTLQSPMFKALRCESKSVGIVSSLQLDSNNKKVGGAFGAHGARRPVFDECTSEQVFIGGEDAAVRPSQSECMHFVFTSGTNGGVVVGCVGTTGEPGAGRFYGCLLENAPGTTIKDNHFEGSAHTDVTNRFGGSYGIADRDWNLVNLNTNPQTIRRSTSTITGNVCVGFVSQSFVPDEIPHRMERMNKLPELLAADRVGFNFGVEPEFVIQSDGPATTVDDLGLRGIYTLPGVPSSGENAIVRNSLDTGIEFTDRLFLVVGATRGMGRAMAEYIANRGGYVIGTTRNSTAGALVGGTWNGALPSNADGIWGNHFRPQTKAGNARFNRNYWVTLNFTTDPIVTAALGGTTAGSSAVSIANMLNGAGPAGHESESIVDIIDDIRVVTGIADLRVSGIILNGGTFMAGKLDMMPEHVIRTMYEMYVVGPHLLIEAFVRNAVDAKAQFTNGATNDIIALTSIDQHNYQALAAPYCAAKWGLEAMMMQRAFEEARGKKFRDTLVYHAIAPTQVRTQIWTGGHSFKIPWGLTIDADDIFANSTDTSTAILAANAGSDPGPDTFIDNVDDLFDQTFPLASIERDIASSLGPMLREPPGHIVRSYVYKNPIDRKLQDTVSYHINAMYDSDKAHQTWAFLTGTADAVKTPLPIPETDLDLRGEFKYPADRYPTENFASVAGVSHPLAGKRVLIIGGASGWMRAAGDRMARLGATVYGTSRSTGGPGWPAPPAAGATVWGQWADGAPNYDYTGTGGGTFVVSDFVNFEWSGNENILPSVNGAAGSTQARFLQAITHLQDAALAHPLPVGARIDIVLIGAGVYMAGKMDGMEEDPLRYMLESYTIGPHIITDLMVRRPGGPSGMATGSLADDGLVITVGSTDTSRAGALDGAYTIAKKATDIFTQCRAMELYGGSNSKPNVDYAVIHPSVVNTDIWTGGQSVKLLGRQYNGTFPIAATDGSGLTDNSFADHNAHPFVDNWDLLLTNFGFPSGIPMPYTLLADTVEDIIQAKYVEADKPRFWVNEDDNAATGLRKCIKAYVPASDADDVSRRLDSFRHYIWGTDSNGTDRTAMLRSYEQATRYMALAPVFNSTFTGNPVEKLETNPPKTVVRSIDLFDDETI